MLKYIIIHSGEDSPLKKEKWHYFIRKTGQVESLTPVGKSTGHCMGKNKESIAVCFERKAFHGDESFRLQLESGIKLLKKLKTQYPKAEILPHWAFLPVLCPSDTFPMDKVVNAVNHQNGIDNVVS